MFCSSILLADWLANWRDQSEVSQSDTDAQHLLASV